MAAVCRRTVILAFGLVLAIPAASGCGDSDEGGRSIVIPHTVIEALDNYAFTSHLEVTEPRGTVNVTFDGLYQAPDRYQGEWNSTGTLALTRAPDVEVIAIGQQVWSRTAQEEWRSSPQQGEQSIDPLLFFLANAAPPFFVNGLTFDSLRLEASGREELNGVQTYRIHFNKAALIATLDQGSFTKEGDKDPAIVREDALAFLPEDTVVEAWLAVDDLRPVRILVSMSASADDTHGDFLVERPFDLRLQMDITDPEAGADIQPPQ